MAKNFPSAGRNKKIRSFFEYLDEKRVFSSISTQMLVIIVAFAIICISSFIFLRKVERNHLLREAENTLAFAEAEIISSLMEPETFLSGYSETILDMLIRGDDEEAVSAHIEDTTNLFLKRNNERLAGLLMIHGYFFTWGGKYLAGRNWTPPDDFDPQESPWYMDAVAAGGQIAVSEPYVDTETGDIIISFSRYLTHDNEPLGVICLSMEFSRVYKYIVDVNITENSYGMLLDNSLKILAHPEPYLINGILYYVNSSLAKVAGDLDRGLEVFERRVKNYLFHNTIVFFRRIEHGWYLGIAIPFGEYYRNVIGMAVLMVVLGGLLAAAICTMLYQISQAKIKSDLRTQQKSNFLATMSHEIRTPLNAILGMTEIQMQNASHPPSTSDAFVKINNSGNLLLNIINDILDLSKIEAGKLELTPVKYEVANLINDIVQLNYIRYESKPIEFNLEVDENVPLILVGDELRIKQILNNLLSNAFKYTDQGIVTLDVNAECVARGGGILVTLIFRVSDTGQGMTQEQMGKLFDEYTRFNLEANRTTEGAGLGMTIVRNLVDLMYGKISVKSVVGEGTTVTVRLPQKTDGMGIRGVLGREVAENLRQFRHGNAVKLKRSQITHEHMPYGRVLIVDDVETNLYVAKGLMAPYGLKIDLASNGVEAVEKIKAGNMYDIVFMDHMMPKMDGIEATKIIREMGYTRPIVALTANALAGQAEMFLKNGFDGFISKPIDIRQLNVSLNKLIRDKQPAEVVEAAHRERAEMEKKNSAGTDQPINSQLAEIFSRDAEKASAVLETCLRNKLSDENDIHMYVINVHAMRSALANIGKTELSAVALRLEQAGREKDINIMLSDTNEFLDALYAVIQEIKPKDEDGESGKETEEALALLREKLVVIKEACAVFDKKTAKNSLNELREKTWSHDTKELLNKIAEHLLHSDFDNAAALADEYIKKF
jgi:signal transduction histidine kinase/CheY-like chemotaxis protein/HPt (histidine-containing phosphotransfer) domain-containing protein